MGEGDGLPRQLPEVRFLGLMSNTASFLSNMGNNKTALNPGPKAALLSTSLKARLVVHRQGRKWSMPRTQQAVIRMVSVRAPLLRIAVQVDSPRMVW